MKSLTILALVCSAALAQTPAKSYTGVVTDTMCGANHAHMGVQPDSKCVRECVKSGHGKYALLVGDKVYTLSDQQSPEAFAAQKVTVTGTLYEKTGILKVEHIAAAK